ncbi:putative E3 ubiquitin-protein ligase HERC3 isoform X2 [Genypterus blacodes]|uniref:putative E3 ubiquitin-protein ligase HERC3 isoform X2 n=1 Tax=Genypterus blacodes TaxID=154954 RepID=UPI003F75F495
MFSWGEDSRGGFKLKSGGDHDAPHSLQLSFTLKDLSASNSALAYIKSDGKAFISRMIETQDGRRVKGKPKYVNYKTKIRAVSCGDDFVNLLSDEGHVLCVDIAQSPYTPRALGGLCNIQVSQVACGSQHSVALTKDGQVYTWGQDTSGQLGLGKRRPGASSPQHLRSLSGMPLVQIAAGGDQSFALSVSGNVFSWGRNNCGQLGLGDTTDRQTPTAVHSLNLKKTIAISCGKDHTTILTKDGAVFTFGSGQYGQLGHNSFTDELHPRLVAELSEAKVTKIACGRHHTLVLTESKQVYAFGCGDQGQLGGSQHQPVPLLVPLSQDTTDGQQIRNLYAGGDCSFASEISNEVRMNNVTQNCLEVLIDQWVSGCDAKSLKKIKREIHRIFSSATCLNQSFLKRSHDKHFQTSPKYSGLDLLLARPAFKKLVNRAEVLKEVEDAVMLLLPSLEKKLMNVEGLRIYLILMELLLAIQRHKQHQSTEFAEAVAAAVLRLSSDSLQILGDWWSSLSSSTRMKYVEVWKKAVALLLSCVPDLQNTSVKNLLKVLQCFYNANNRMSGPERIPEKQFCLSFGVEFIQADLILWRLTLDKGVDTVPLLICGFPFVMDLQTKKMAFDMYAEYVKQETVQKIMQQNLLWFIGWPHLQSSEVNLELNLKRAAVLEGTLEQMAVAHPSTFKRRLVVLFDENEHSQLNMKDFFHYVFHDMMKSGMFMFNDSKTLAWFPCKAKEDNTYYLFGVLCGLALYNNSLTYLPFPVALFKKLVNVEPTLEDMKEFQPELEQSLQCILDISTDDDTYLDFSVPWDGMVVELDPENPGKSVTRENKTEFVNAYVSHVFNASVQRVFEEFKRGFFHVIDVDLVMMFRPEELKGIMVGKDIYDWDKVKQDTVYEGVYNEDHHTIQMFWKVFEELTEDLKRALVFFVTGFQRVPILGNITMTVRDLNITDDSDRYLPLGYTCYSLLDLPIYSTKAIMQARLTEALNSKGGFK